jgi:thiamine pyrophosphate-dependent acetolactate synthase large subunit-like protein
MTCGSLGCLATIGMVAPRNLTIMDNGIYQITGKQKAATAGTADIVAIARGAGIASSHWVRDASHFDELTSRAFDADGPALLAAKIDDAPGTGQTVRDPPLIRHRFMRGLCTGRASALDG